MARSKFEKWVEVVFAFIFFFVSSTMMSVFIRWSVNWNAKDYDSIEAFGIYMLGMLGMFCFCIGAFFINRLNFKFQHMQDSEKEEAPGPWQND